MTQNTKRPRDCVVGVPPPGTACPTIANPYPAPSESPDYVAIGPGYQHQELYKCMKGKVAKIHMQFIKVKSMTGFCNVKVFEAHSELCTAGNRWRTLPNSSNTL